MRRGMMRVMTMMTASCMRRVSRLAIVVVARIVVRVAFVRRVEAARVLATPAIARRVRGRRRGFVQRRRLALLLFLHLHASILKPDFDLAFGELQHGRELDATWPTQIAQVVEFLLELDELCARVGCARSFVR